MRILPRIGAFNPCNVATRWMLFRHDEFVATVRSPKNQGGSLHTQSWGSWSWSAAAHAWIIQHWKLGNRGKPCFLCMKFLSTHGTTYWWNRDQRATVGCQSRATSWILCLRNCAPLRRRSQCKVDGQLLLCLQPVVMLLGRLQASHKRRRPGFLRCYCWQKHSCYVGGRCTHGLGADVHAAYQVLGKVSGIKTLRLYLCSTYRVLTIWSSVKLEKHRNGRSGRYLVS